MNINNIIITNENGRLVVSSQAVEEYDRLQELINEYTKQQKELKSKILDEMIKNGITSSKTNQYTISLIQPKDKEIFDSDSFIEKEEVAIISLFTDFKNELDEEKLKKDFPEIYEKCLTKTSYTIDTEKLKKSLPDIYNKYITIEENTKEPTLQFRGRK